jgi:hypothetical protein
MFARSDSLTQRGDKTLWFMRGFHARHPALILAFELGILRGNPSLGERIKS